MAAIKVVICEPNKKARIKIIDNGLDSMQSVVDGFIECVYPFDEEVCLVCNDEGKYNGCLPNRALYDEDGEMVDIIFGTFFIADCSGEEFGSLNDEQLQRYIEKYESAERFVRIGNRIVSIKC